jgi:hypothetical protein
MSVFEDLIGELKNENLLEDTIIDLGRADAAARGHKTAAAEAKTAGAAASAAVMRDDDFHPDLPQIEEAASDKEFFRKRAMEEVSSLQMVEHVFSGVEREHLKVAAESFDDLNTKKALHKFLHVAGDPSSAEHAEAEYALRHETEAWNFALYARDQKISVANIRRFCEESRPVLSSQALIALARFYRNSPYSEDVRSKFDYVMTRLFSRESGEETRRLLFAEDKMIGHINTLYANWSSIALYTSQDDQVEVSLTVTRFDEFTIEVESAVSFDELLDSDFFNRVRVYKEGSSEMFYVPEVLAAAIKCNLEIGNRYVELIARERLKKGPAKIEEKYGTEYDQIVSNAAGKTLNLTDVLALEIDSLAGDAPEQSRPTVPALSPSKPRVINEETGGSRFDLFGINKWLMLVCVIFILAGGGVYLWAEKVAGGGETSELTAKPIAIDDPEIKKYLRSPHFASETFYAVTEPSFETLTQDERRELLGKVRNFAKSRSLKKVTLVNAKGRTVAFASDQRFELIGE